MAEAQRVAEFLRDAGWSSATALPIAGDASARMFTRLTQPGKSAILMDASADTAGSSARFSDISRWLIERGYSAPTVLAADLPAELLLVEDFGNELVAHALAAQPSREAEFYTATAEFLASLQRHAPPPHLSRLDGTALAQLTDLALDWYVPGADPAQKAASKRVPALIASLYEDLAGADPLVASLRDFHAENVIWLPERQGSARLGLLDFQDAVAAHPAYDLVSFLQDARRDLQPGTEARTIDLFCALTGRDPAGFMPVYALIGAQRALRILGVFARLICQAGKPRYAQFIPRVWRHLGANLTHPALSELAEAVRHDIPEPTAGRIERMVATCPTA
jgi:N-acetylmuramate 1-kinase